MKKILAVATALVLAISSLCVFVFADEATTVEYNFNQMTQNTSIASWGYTGSSVSTDGVLTAVLTANYNGGSIGYDLPSEFDATTLTKVSFDIDFANDSDESYLAIAVYRNGTQIGTKYGTTEYDLSSVDKSEWSADDVISVTVKNNTYTTYAEGTTEYAAAKVDRTFTVNSVSVTAVQNATSEYYFNYGDVSDWNTESLSWTFTPSDYCTDSISAGDNVTITVTLSGNGYFNGTVGANSNSAWASLGQSESSGSGTSYSATWTWTVDIDSDYAQVQIWWMNDGMDGVEVTGIEVVNNTASGSLINATSTASGIIYVNEDYHALLLNGYFISIPHTDDNGDGYCDVCNEYIGSEDSELEVVTIDGVDYYVVVSNELNSAAGNWNSYALGDSTFAAALNTEGAILQITRDTETAITFVDGSVYEKFIISASSNVALGTGGHTIADEASIAVDAASDDGYVVTYDGAAVYAALEAAGIADASSYSLISNTSESYTITSVAVLVPVGTVVGEDVDVTEPAEEGDTTTEDDGEEDADSVDVADNADDAAESNPTTGVVLALVPMAIAGFAVVASKRR